jgi:hypothetical protein
LKILDAHARGSNFWNYKYLQSLSTQVLERPCCCPWLLMTLAARR